ncbi:MAG: protein kinase [Deltaproteobacteria bacterium]|nr:protein kinase [Deltaproteobacteria bacterium]
MEDEAPRTPSELPLRFGKYLLVERIAQGGMAEIFKAKSYGVSGFEKTIVIKRILPTFSNDKEFIEMLIDEAKICAGLQHSNIVQIFDLGRLEGRYFIAMEYVRGVDLVLVLNRLRKARTRLPLELACFIMSEALKGLDYAHRACGPEGEPLKIIHRDFNPANILLSYQGEVKVADFGIAKASHRHHETMSGGLKGKMGYLSPEQVAGKDLDPRSDVFVAGITFWEMLTCRRMFASGTELDILIAIRDAIIPDVKRYAPEIGDDLVAIAGKSLTREPAERYRSAAEFREALDDFLFDRGIKIDSSHLEAYLKHLFADKIEGEKKRVEAEHVEPTRMQPPKYWLRNPSAQPMGPMELAELVEMIGSGRVSHSADVLREGGTWVNITKVPELAVQMSQLPTPEESDPDAVATYQGMLVEVSFPRLFYRMAIAKEIGRLVLTRPGVKKEIYLRDGFPEFVKSNLLSERLGEYLVECKAITVEQRDEAVRVMKGFSGRLGDTLIGMGVLKPHELFEHLSMQVKEKILEVFSWASGTYRFFEGQAYKGEVVPLKIGGFALLSEGVRTYTQVEMLRNRYLPQIDRRVERMDNPYLAVERLGLQAREQRVVDLIDGQRTAREILTMGGSDRGSFDLAVYRTLYMLEELEMARLAD